MICPRKALVAVLSSNVCALHTEPVVSEVLSLSAMASSSHQGAENAEEVLDESYNHKKLRVPVTLSLATTPLIVVLRRLAAYAGLSLVVDDSIQGWVPLLEARGESLGTVLHALLSERTPPCGVLMIGSVLHVGRKKQLIARARRWLRGTDVHTQSTTISLIHRVFTEQFKLQLEAMWYQCCRQYRWPSRSAYFFIDEVNHQILVQGSQEQITAFRSLISSLDKPGSQVCLRAHVVMANTDFINQFGIKSRILGGEDSPPSSSLPFVFGLGIGRSLHLLLEWAERHNKVQTLIAPTITSVSGRKAYLLEGESVPIESLTEESVDGKVRATRSAKYKEVGVRMKVRPFIFPDHSRVRLDVLVENSRVTGSSSSGYPSIITSKVHNSVVLASGQTVLLGGIGQASVSTERDAVPFWSKIPLLGRLFCGSSSKRVVRRLYVFITADVVKW